MNEPTSNHCPECGNPVPADSQHQLCPACLMAQAFASRTLNSDRFPSAPAPTPDEIAGKFPQFEILECLGRGGMGIVYKARQKSLNRLVAIKILAPERDHDARFAERFAREAELLAKLSHPHIVTIHDFGETDGLYFLVMEFVDGVNLRDLLRDGKLEPKQALAIVPPICEALQYAHDQAIVHRDIKPENLLLDRGGRIKIADFGIASLIGANDEKSGTPPYMAPEQNSAPSEVDHRADIYALGVVFYEMLTGERPGKDFIAPSKRVRIDVRIDEMVLRALESAPELRYQTAAEFRTVLETLVVDERRVPIPPAPFRRTFAARTAVVILLGLVLLFGAHQWVFKSKTPGPQEKIVVPVITRNSQNPFEYEPPELPSGTLLRATVRIIDVPAEVDYQSIIQPSVRLTDKRLRVLAVLRSVLKQGQEGVINMPWVMGREYKRTDLTPRDGWVFVRAEIRGSTVSYDVSSQEAPTEGVPNVPEKKFIGHRQVVIGAQDVLEGRLISFGRKQVTLISFDWTPPDSTPGPMEPATGGYTYGPVIERVVNDPAQTTKDCLIDLDTGELADLPEEEGLKKTVKSDFRQALGIIRERALTKGMDATGRVSEKEGDFDPKPGLVGAYLKTRSYTWKSRDAGAAIERLSPTDFSSDRQPKFIEIPFDSLDLLHDVAWRFTTDEGRSGLLQVTGFGEDKRGVKIRYKLVEPPSIAWDPLPGTKSTPPDFSEEALLEGGGSSEYEVRIHGQPYDEPFGYEIRIYAAGQSEPIYTLEDVGGWMRYSEAKESCKAYWSQEANYVVISDRGTKRSSSIQILALDGNRVERLKLPDYLKQARSMVGATETYPGAASLPERWDGNDFRLKLGFDTRGQDYSCDVVLHLAHPENSPPVVTLKSCSTPQQASE